MGAVTLDDRIFAVTLVMSHMSVRRYPRSALASDVALQVVRHFYVFSNTHPLNLYSVLLRYGWQR